MVRVETAQAACYMSDGWCKPHLVQRLQAPETDFNVRAGGESRQAQLQAASRLLDFLTVGSGSSLLTHGFVMTSIRDTIEWQNVSSHVPVSEELSPSTKNGPSLREV
jgi:hypothetical protein